MTPVKPANVVARGRFPLALSLLLVSAAAHVLLPLFGIAMRLQSLGLDVGTLQRLGRPYAFVYVGLASAIGYVLLAAATFLVVLRATPRTAARMGLVLHGALLLKPVMDIFRGGSIWQVLLLHPVELAWLVVVAVLLWPLAFGNPAAAAAPATSPAVDMSAQARSAPQTPAIPTAWLQPPGEFAAARWRPGFLLGALMLSAPFWMIALAVWLAETPLSFLAIPLALAAVPIGMVPIFRAPLHLVARSLAALAYLGPALLVAFFTGWMAASYFQGAHA